jgi:hypothetical protein
MNLLRLCVAALAVSLVPLSAAAGAMDECEEADAEATAKCLGALDLETLAALKKSETATGRAARGIEESTKRPGAYTAFAASSRAFALYQQAQCDYVRAIQPDANVRPTTPAASVADMAKTACRIDLARERIEILK